MFKTGLRRPPKLLRMLPVGLKNVEHKLGVNETKHENGTWWLSLGCCPPLWAQYLPWSKDLFS